MQTFVNQIDVLLVTATDIESNEILENMLPIEGATNLIVTSVGHHTYYIGTLGLYNIALVQSGMGAVGRTSSLLTSIRAIEVWMPKMIIMVGIAFGIDSKNQQIGDVIIASHIIPYEIQRIGKEKVFRSELPASNTLLLNRVKQIRNWKFSVSKSSLAKLYVGPILSGEKLIDDKKFRDDLLSYFPNAIGGEMEATGIYVAAEEKKIPWIVIKGICDFADGNKSDNKQLFQRLAIKAAANFTKRLLNIRYGFNAIGIYASVTSGTEEQIATEDDTLKNIISLIEEIKNKRDQKTSDVMRLAARQISQNENDSNVAIEMRTIQMLAPPDTIQSFKDRIKTCWDTYNEMLGQGRQYFPSELDDAGIALQRCICREIRRLQTVNGSIPNGSFMDYWITYKCTELLNIN